MKALYKILNSLLVLTIIPAVIFLPLFKFITTYDKINEFLDSYGLGEQISLISLKNAVEQIKLNTAQNGTDFSFSFDLLPAEIKKWLTVFAVFTGITGVIAVIILILGLFTKKKTVTAAFSLTGLITAFFSNFCFNKAAYPLISGQVDLIELYSEISGNSSIKTIADLAQGFMSILGSENQQLGAMLQGLVGGYTDIDIRILRLSDAYTIVLVIFGAILALNLLMKMFEYSKKD